MKKLLPKTSNNSQGFTLVELLVVISIIAILAVIGLTIFSGTQRTARNGKRQADVKAIAAALEAHYNYTADQFCNPVAGGLYCPLDDSWFAGGARPVDPSTGADYGGVAAAMAAGGSATYTITANLEPSGVFTVSNQQ